MLFCILKLPISYRSATLYANLGTKFDLKNESQLSLYNITQKDVWKIQASSVMGDETLHACVLLNLNLDSKFNDFPVLTITIDSIDERSNYYLDLTGEFDHNFETTPDDTVYNYVS